MTTTTKSDSLQPPKGGGFSPTLLITSDMPNGSQKDNGATSFIGQYSMLCVSKIAVGIACGV